MLAHDLFGAVRTLSRSPGFVTVSVLTLALAIGACTAVFSLYDHLVVRALPFHQPDQLANVMGRVAAKAEYVAVRDRVEAFEQVAAHSPVRGITLTGDHEPERVRVTRVSANLFSTLGSRPSIGRTLLAGEDGRDRVAVVILSHAFWREHFGADTEVVGRTLVLDGQSYEIVGVMPQEVQFPSRDVQLWLPLRLNVSDASDYWSNWHLHLIGRLRDGVDATAATEQIRALAAQLRLENPLWTPEESYVDQLRVEPLKAHLIGNVFTPLSVLMAAVAIVLLMACVNLANLFLARSLQRQRDWAIRSALGAGSGRLARETAAELFWVVLPGGLLGIGLAWMIVRVIPGFVPMDLPSLSPVTLDGRVLGFALFATLLAGVAAGLVPVLRAASRHPQAALASGRAAGDEHRSRLTRVLVAAQIALAAVLLIGAGLLLRTLAELDRVEPGFAAENIITARLDPVPNQVADDTARRTLYRDLLEQVHALGSIDHAGLTSLRPLEGAGAEMTAFDLKHDPQDPGNLPMAHFPHVTPDYLRAMRIELLRGRLFDDSDRADAPGVALVNQTFARRYFGDDDPVGRQVGQPWADHWWTIIGVVGDVKYEAMDRDEEPTIYRPFDQAPRESAVLAVRTRGDPAGLLTALRRAVTATGAQIAISEIYSATELVELATEQPRFAMRLLAGFAGAALLLAMIGIYGVMAQMVNRRRREIGVRMAVGASAAKVLSFVLCNTLLLTVLGIASGLLAAFAATRFLEAMLFGITPVDWLTYIGVAGVVLISAMLAAALPAHRATRIDPMAMIRVD